MGDATGDGRGFTGIRCVGVIETSATQRYVFAANRQAENIGASHLIVSVTKDVLDSAAVPGVVPIVSSSGLLVFGAADQAPLVEMIRTVTDAAWERAPGLEITGGIGCLDEPPETAAQAQDLLSRAFRAVKAEQAERPSMTLRFPINPLTEVCDTGLGPAVETVTVKNTERTLGTQALAKHNVRNEAWLGIREMLDGVDVVRNVEAFDDPRNDDEDRWMAVVHADGNGVGRVIQDFLQHADITDGTATEFWESYSEFSSLLEDVTTSALREAARKVESRSGGLLFPVLVGGDDVTVILPGEVSLEFVEELIIQFSLLAKANPETGTERPLTEGLSMSAGISITKPHYPFHASYVLADSLASSAKSVPATSDGERMPAFDFHMLFDAAPSTLQQLRKRLEIKLPGDGNRVRMLTAKPMTLDDFRLTRSLARQLGNLSMSTVNELRSAIMLPGDPGPYFAIAHERSENPVPSFSATLTKPPDQDGEVTRYMDALEILRIEK